MRRDWLCPVVVLLVVLLMAAPSGAQQTSNLTGVVTDAQSAVLPGVTVTATSPALIGTQTVVTEPNGSYRFATVPPGVYTLTFELSGFQTVKRANIVLALGQTLTVDTQLQVQSLQESVTVTAASPVVDTQTTSMGSTLTTAKLIGVPSATDLWSALARAPGVRMQGYDVGGSHKSEQSGYEAFGVRGQSRVVTEGVDTTEGSGGAGFYQDYYAQNEIAVSAAGQDVTMNTPGAAVISTIKSGGNDFKSLVTTSWEPKSWIANNIDAATKDRGFTGVPNNKFWEFHPDLGGPIVKDKLWFFGAYNHFTIDEDITGVPHDRATYQGYYNNYTTKETYKATEKDTIIGYYQLGRLRTPNRNLSAVTSPDSTVTQASSTHMYNGKWQRIWTNRLFSELNVGDFGYHFPEAPLVDFATNPPRIDQTTTVQTGAAWAAAGANGPFIIERNKPQIFATVTYFLPSSVGSHDIKTGLEWFDDAQLNESTGQSGVVYYQDLSGKPDQVQLFNMGPFSTLGTAWTGADNRNRREALFLQDRWSMNARVTLTAGVRYDRQRPYYESSISAPVLSDIFPAVTTPGATLLVRNTVAPRVGVSWDLQGDGTSAVKAFYGRYYNNMAQDLANLNPGGVNSRTYKFLDQNGNGLYDGATELGALVSTTGGTTTKLDPNLKVPYTDELDASYQRQFWGESSVRVAYVRKMVRNVYATFNIARDGQFTVPFAATVPLTSVNGGSQGSQTFNLMDIPASLRGVVQNEFANIPDSVGGGSFNYDTFEVAFNKRFSGSQFIDASFDYLRRDELRQNSASTNPFNTDPLMINYFQNVNPAVPNRQSSSNWQLHLSGRYDLPYEIGVGANVQVQSGWPFARLVTVSLPTAGTQTFFLEDIDNNRSDTVPLVGVRVDKSVHFDSHRILFMFDMFNALNSNAVTNFALSNGASYNKIIATLQPRTFQLGVRLEF
ncbi:MAG TPA: carboxypeptidase regulatory-like domain-containing protein [Vicinamibacterales bacterium]|nr:carboxypeptidase regulatory-like domain-containing protein [Vicinamibacterales bacterium]